MHLSKYISRSDLTWVSDLTGISAILTDIILTLKIVEYKYFGYSDIESALHGGDFANFSLGLFGNSQTEV